MIIQHTVHRHRVNWRFSILLIVSLSLWLSGCNIQSRPPRVYRVGILAGSGPFLEIADGFKAGMTEAGYIEGENIVYDYRDAGADLDDYQRAAQQLVDEQVDLIFAFPTPATLVAKTVTQGTSIPVVFAYAGIEGTDLVASVREPGGHMTGVRYPGPEQISKRLETLLELAPEVKRIWITYEQNHPNSAITLETLRPAALSNGVTLVEVPVTSLEDLQRDLAARSSTEDIGLDAMLLMPDGINHSTEGLQMMYAFAEEQHVPLAGSFRYTVEEGALFGNANNFFKVGELAAPLADKVLQGVPAGSIPLVTPDQDLWINYTVAQKLGLTVPEGLLKQASEVIH